MLSWRSLPVRLAATLAAGLPPDSRSARKVSGQRASADELMQASIADSLNRLEWRICGCPGRAPMSFVMQLLGQDADPDSASDVQSFDTPEEFEAAMRAAEGGESDDKRH